MDDFHREMRRIQWRHLRRLIFKAIILCGSIALLLKLENYIR
jgi:hypothetical protein